MTWHVRLAGPEDTEAKGQADASAGGAGQRDGTEGGDAAGGEDAAAATRDGAGPSGEGPSAQAEGGAAEPEPEPEPELSEKEKRAAEKKAARKKAREQVAGGNFGEQQELQVADAESSKLPNAVPAENQNVGGESHKNGGTQDVKRTQEEEDDAFLDALARDGDEESQKAVVENVVTNVGGERPRSAKSARSFRSGRSGRSSINSAQESNDLPVLYLLGAEGLGGTPPASPYRLLELVSDKDGNPLRLDDHDTYDTIWDHESQTSSQLMDMLVKAEVVSRLLYDTNLIKRKVIQSQGARYLLVGSMLDFDNPTGSPQQLLDPETEDVVWDRATFGAMEQWSVLTKHARVVGTHHTALRMLFVHGGVTLEMIEDATGQAESSIVDFVSRATIWSKEQPDAQAAHARLLDQCEHVGRVVVKWTVDAPPPPPPAFTILDLALWQCQCKSKDQLVFTWMGQKGKNATPFHGTTLKDKCGKSRMPQSVVIKTASAEMRDEWYKRIYAASIWARASQTTREEWIEMSNEYARASADNADAGGFVMASTFVKKTEDQLDAFREWVLLIFDYPRKMFGWSGPKKSAMEEFKADVAAQICAGMNLPEARVRVKAVHKADSKKTWKLYRPNPSFYLAVAKKCKSGGVLVEIVIEPDLEGLERKERNPDSDFQFVVSKHAAEDIVKQCTDAASALRNSGKIVQTLMHGEIKDPDDGQDDMKGDPIWIELAMGAQKQQTKVKGSQSSEWNECFRFYFERHELEAAIVHLRIFTTRTYGGKKLLGKCRLEAGPLVPNTVTPMQLQPDENEHGMIVCQCKYTPHPDTSIQTKKGPYRKPILKELPALGLKERHLCSNDRDEQRLIDLKQVLCIETNVYQDYPAMYAGMDALGRAKLDGLIDLGDRIADDIFTCLKGYGTLKMAVDRPMDMLSLEKAQHAAYQEMQGYVCAGRYEPLMKAQQFVADAAHNSVLVISGKPGTGKSNVMACLHRMFVEGLRVVPNPHTKRPQMDPVVQDSKHPRGNSWHRPEVVSMFMGASNGNNTPRYMLYLLMNQLAEILRVCHMKVEKSEHKQKVAPADPSVLYPIPHEYNTLRLQFLTLCQNIDKFVPHKRILILIDQIDAIDAMRFDWLPVDIPKSLRLVISCGKSNLIKKMAASTKSLKIDLLQLQPFPMLARKEMVTHLLRKRDRAINMEQMDALVLHQGANMPDYLHIVTQVLADFKQDMRHVMPVINYLEETTESVASQVLARMEEYCGRNLVKQCLGLIFVSMYGLNEFELRMILAMEAENGGFLADVVGHRLPEEHDGTAAGYPKTSRENRIQKFHEKNAILPSSLWSTLSHMLRPYLAPSHPSQAGKFQFLLKSFASTVATRYDFETEDARVGLHKKIAAYYRARADPELQYSWRSTDYRAAQLLIYHKIGAHEWNQLKTILMDLGFIEFCVNVGQVHGLCNDLKHAISAIDSVGKNEGADMTAMMDLMQLSSFMNGNAQLFLEFPGVLVQSMANEAPTSTVAQIAKRRVQGGWEGRNWFKRLRSEVMLSANIRTMRGHKGWIRALAVTQDAKYVVSGADDKTARFWSVDSGAVIHLLIGHREAITAVDISSNGLYLITSSMDTSVKLWDIRPGIELANLYVGSAATCCKFSHDAALILAGTLDSTLHLFDMRTFQELHVMKSHRLGIRAAIFSKDSTTILSAGSDGLVMQWDLSTFTGKKFVEAPNAVMKGHSNGIRALAWNPRNAGQAVSGGDDCIGIVWNLRNGSITRKLVGHSAPLLSLSFTPSGAYVISSSHDSSLIVWDPNLDEVLFRFWGHMGPVYCVVMSVDEYSAISAGADSTIRTWDVRGLLREDPDEPHILSKEVSSALKDEKKPEFKAHTKIQYGDIYCLAFSPAGDVLLAGSQDTSYALRSIEDGEVIGEPRRGHAGAVYACEWHPDGVRILTGSEDAIIKMWEASSGRLLRAFKGHDGPVFGCKFFPDGAQLVSVSSDHYIRIWDVETGRAINKMPPHLGHLSSVRCCATSPDNNIFCTGGDDDFVRVWDKRSNMLIRKLISHSDPILSVAFGVDGGSMLSGGLDRSVRLWDMTGALVNKWEHFSGCHPPVVLACEIPAIAKHLAQSHVMQGHHINLVATLIVLPLADSLP